MKCVVILSEKSSGSTACQGLLAHYGELSHVTHTKHYAHETLYWTLAASVLNLPQDSAIDSKVPYPASEARSQILELVKANTGEDLQDAEDSVLVDKGWRFLCEQHGPIFLEKSPHHLAQKSSLNLLLSWMEKNPEIETTLIGLVRNPMDTVYSQFRRWRARPEGVEKQWRRAYSNLLSIKEQAGEALHIIRYEDLSKSVEPLYPVLNRLELEKNAADRTHMHSKSHNKWRGDPNFGFALSKSTILLAQRYGYEPSQMINNSQLIWPIQREATRLSYKIKSKLGLR